MSDDEVAGDPSAEEEQVAGDVPRVGPRRVGRQGPLRIYLIVASSVGFWHREYRAIGDPTLDLAAGTQAIVGAVLAYTFLASPCDADDEQLQFLRRQAVLHTHGATRYSFLEYPFVERVCFDAPVVLPADLLTPLAMLHRISHLQGQCCGAGHLCRDSISSIFQRWQGVGANNPRPAFLTPPLACRVVRGL